MLFKQRLIKFSSLETHNFSIKDAQWDIFVIVTKIDKAIVNLSFLISLLILSLTFYFFAKDILWNKFVIKIRTNKTIIKIVYKRDYKKDTILEKLYSR